jgi:large subunit ribosomal protein L31e
MTEVKQTQKGLEREYVIPLRREWMKVSRYKRTAKGVKAIKEFIARHMRVPDRDINKVKLDMYLNNELWFRGGKKPPTKVKVRAVKEDEIVRVELVETPDIIKFSKIRQDKRHKKVEKKKVEAKSEEGLEERVEPSVEKTEEDKIKEEEKVKSVEQANIRLAEQSAKAQKHAISKDKGPQIHRKALKK